MRQQSLLLAILATATSASAFVTIPSSAAAAATIRHSNTIATTADIMTSIVGAGRRTPTTLNMAEDGEAKAAPLVTGEELEGMLQEWDMPLVVDAYATW